MKKPGKATVGRWAGMILLSVTMVLSLHSLDRGKVGVERQERLYFPSGRFLEEASLGFREAAADYLWFRFIQYYGAFAKGHNDLRYFDLLIGSITRLDPRFAEAYHLASLIRLSDFGDLSASLDLLKRGIHHNQDVAKLKFQVGFIYHVFTKDYLRAAFWFEEAGRCSDASDRERRFAAFARYRGGDDEVSLELWKMLWSSTESPQMKELAEKMIAKLEYQIQNPVGDDENLIGPPLELQ